MLSSLRELYGRLLAPLAKALLSLRCSPTAVSIAGTVGVCLASLGLLARGDLVVGPLAVAVFLLGDGLDGTMARMSGTVSRFGGFLDSTLDRVADAAVFGALAMWAAGDDDLSLCLALVCMACGMLVSYVRARAEAEGWDASGGLFERSERLIVALAGAFAVGLGAPAATLTAGLGVVAAGSCLTVMQRVFSAHQAARTHGDDQG